MCDDEPLALDRLAALLARCDGVELIGSMLSGRALLDEVQALQPALILLDIEMPQVDGFDVVEALSRMSWPESAAPPLIIFVTAHLITPAGTLVAEEEEEGLLPPALPEVPAYKK